MKINIKQTFNGSDLAALMEFLIYPLGSTDAIFNRFAKLGADPYGAGLRRFMYFRGARETKVLLVAHADTVWDLRYHDTRLGTIETHGITKMDGIIRSSTEGFGIGADDRAGCAMVWLLRELGHSILITDGEEHGQLGSTYLAEEHPAILNEINSSHQFAVQLDRRNDKEFKCYDVGTDEFRQYIQRTTGFTEPDRKASTDIRKICRQLTGVNLSIGYRDEHKPNEELNIIEWANTLKLCREWLAHPDLPKFAR